MNRQRVSHSLLVVLLTAGHVFLFADEKPSSGIRPRTFDVRGIVRQNDPPARTVLVEHEAISNYMAAMTMPFKTRSSAELKDLNAGDAIRFRLLVTEDDSWIEAITRLSTNAPLAARTAPAAAHGANTSHPLMSCRFTNELGTAVTLADFKGQALGITFFFTRCPIPNFCPRLSKNFEEASAKLLQDPSGPTNWHLLSVTFDPAFDTPAVLQRYAEQYHYNSNHWSFLTGPPEKLKELAKLSEVSFEPDGAFFNHNFHTLIIDAAGRLQVNLPIGGNLSEIIARELIKACAATNAGEQPAAAASHP
jgi:protein SCO1/2